MKIFHGNGHTRDAGTFRPLYDEHTPANDQSDIVGWMRVVLQTEGGPCRLEGPNGLVDTLLEARSEEMVNGAIKITGASTTYRRQIGLRPDDAEVIWVFTDVKTAF